MFIRHVIRLSEETVVVYETPWLLAARVWPVWRRLLRGEVY